MNRSFIYFETVAQCKSIRTAATKLDISPSAISRQISSLEVHMGVSLLERHMNGSVPTDAGKLLLEHIAHLRRDEQSFLNQINDLKNLDAGHIRIAIGGGYTSDLVNTALIPFSRLYPKITFELSLGNTSSILAAVCENRTDVGLVFDPPFHPDIQSISICCQPLYLIVNASDSRFSPDFPVDLNTLQNDSFALISKSHGVRQLIMRYQAETTTDLPVSLESDSFEAIKLAVMDGGKLSVLPRFCVQQEINRGILQAIPIQHPLLNGVSSHIVIRKGRQLCRKLKLFTEHLCLELDACH